MNLATEVSKDRWQPSTVRMGTVVAVNPLQVSVQNRIFKRVGVLSTYTPQVNDVVAVVGQSAVSADGSSWLVLGHASPQDVAAAHIGVLAYGFRTTSSSGTTGETSVLRLDNIPIFPGRLLRASTATSLIFNSTVAGDLIEARLYHSFTGTAVTGGIPFGVVSNNSRTAGGAQFTDGVIGYLPTGTATGNLSVLLTILRAAGTGTVNFPASATYPIWIVVEDLGVDTGNAGIPL